MSNLEVSYCPFVRKGPPILDSAVTCCREIKIEWGCLVVVTVHRVDKPGMVDGPLGRPAMRQVCEETDSTGSDFRYYINWDCYFVDLQTDLHIFTIEYSAPTPPPQSTLPTIWLRSVRIPRLFRRTPSPPSWMFTCLKRSLTKGQAMGPIGQSLACLHKFFPPPFRALPDAPLRCVSQTKPHGFYQDKTHTLNAVSVLTSGRESNLKSHGHAQPEQEKAVCLS
ncbi:hypothetical protein EDB92DRAFT_1882938, partial [Lactarius akahatsu]